MRKVLTLLLGLLAVIAAAYWVLEGGLNKPAPRDEQSGPKRRLDNVRRSVHAAEEQEESRKRAIESATGEK